MNMSELATELCSRLEARRLELNMSQFDLAARLNITEATLRRLIAGEGKMNKVVEAAVILGMVEDIFVIESQIAAPSRKRISKKA
jgi:transcriptional regulator with XRE-family HTH domain